MLAFLNKFLIGKEELLSLVSRAFALVLQLLIIRELTLKLGVDDYGQYIYIFSIVGMTVQFDFGLAIYVQNKLSKGLAQGDGGKNVYAYLLSNSLILSTLILLVGLIILYFIHNKIAQNVSLLMLYAIFICAILYTYSLVFVRTVYSRGSGRWVFYSQTLFLFTFYLAIILNLFDFNENEVFYWVLTYYLLYSIFNFCLAFLKGIDWDLFKFSCSCSELNLWLKESRGFWIYGMIGLVITQADIIILGYFGDFEELAYYSVITKVFFAGGYTFISVYMMLTHPKITADWESKSFLRASQKLKSALLLAMTATSLFILLFEFLKIGIIQTIMPTANHSFLEQGWVYWFYLFFVFRVMSDTMLMFFMAISKAGLINKVTILQMLISFPLQLFLFNEYGIEGVVIALVASYLFTLLVFVKWYFLIKESVYR